MATKLKIFWFILIGILACSDEIGPSMIPQDATLEDSDSEHRARDTQNIELKDGQICVPGSHQCLGNNFLTCIEDGTDWEVERCKEGTYCTPEGCKETSCRPGETRCANHKSLEICKVDGSGWSNPQECPRNTVCVGGECVERECNPGEKKCIKNAVATCKEDGDGWETSDCGDDKVCFHGRCIECVEDENCPEGMKCVEGKCTLPPPKITTEELPPGNVGKPYEAKLEAEGGHPPYKFEIVKGGLAPGVKLQGDTITGTPTAQGKFNFTVRLTDSGSMTDEKELLLVIAGAGLTIVSRSPLPQAEAEKDYEYQFKAAGGTPPYGWIFVKGQLPPGYVLDSKGIIKGNTDKPGDYKFTVKVVDESDPIQAAKGEFELTVKVAPLRIVGKQMLNLYVTKVVILPLITVVQGVPIPYHAKLEAKGGLKPYHWKEIQIPGMLKQWFPKAGLPQGLTLADDGTISGSVTDTSQVMEVTIPFANITLKGFAFMAQVTDSQTPPDSDQGLFFIPTVPVNLGGGGLPFGP